MSTGQLPARIAVQVECYESSLSMAETQPAFSNCGAKLLLFFDLQPFYQYFLCQLVEITSQ
jgi:hypothetical protein